MKQSEFNTKHPNWEFDIVHEEVENGYPTVNCCFNKSSSLVLDILSKDIESCFDIADKLIPLVESVDLSKNDEYLKKVS